MLELKAFETVIVTLNQSFSLHETAARFKRVAILDIVKNYYATSNTAEAGRLVGAHSPNHSTVLRLIQKFGTASSVKCEQRSSRPSFFGKEEFQAAVLHEIHNTPTATPRITCQRDDLSGFHVFTR